MCISESNLREVFLNYFLYLYTMCLFPLSFLEDISPKHLAFAFAALIKSFLSLHLLAQELMRLEDSEMLQTLP